MSRIESVRALEILDSRGNPTIRVQLSGDVPLDVEKPKSALLA